MKHLNHQLTTENKKFIYYGDTAPSDYDAYQAGLDNQKAAAEAEVRYNTNVEFSEELSGLVGKLDTGLWNSKEANRFIRSGVNSAAADRLETVPLSLASAGGAQRYEELILATIESATEKFSGIMDGIDRSDMSTIRNEIMSVPSFSEFAVSTLPKAEMFQMLATLTEANDPALENFEKALKNKIETTIENGDTPAMNDLLSDLQENDTTKRWMSTRQLSAALGKSTPTLVAEDIDPAKLTNIEQTASTPVDTTPRRGTEITDPKFGIIRCTGNGVRLRSAENPDVVLGAAYEGDEMIPVLDSAGKVTRVTGDSLGFEGNKGRMYFAKVRVGNQEAIISTTYLEQTPSNTDA